MKKIHKINLLSLFILITLVPSLTLADECIWVTTDLFTEAVDTAIK